MPPPVPGTGLSSHFRYGAPAQVPAFNPGIYPTADKSVGVAYLLWLLLGLFGAHHFYLGKVGRGIGYFFTCAWLTIGLWIDLFTLPAQVKLLNAQRRAGLR